MKIKISPLVWYSPCSFRLVIIYLRNLQGCEGKKRKDHISALGIPSNRAVQIGHWHASARGEAKKRQGSSWDRDKSWCHQHPSHSNLLPDLTRPWQVSKLHQQKNWQRFEVAQRKSGNGQRGKMRFYLSCLTRLCLCNRREQLLPISLASYTTILDRIGPQS